LEFKTLHLFAGSAGGELGFKYAVEEFRGMVGKFRNLCGIDVDPEACEDYERLTGSRAVQMDLFSREQYIDFHGHEPPADWQEATPYDIWRTTNGEAPDVVFTSPPCKGFSGLLPEKSAQTKKYQALNKLTVRGIKLCLDAFEDDLPSLFLLENVTRITSRGSELLKEIKDLLKKYGYAIDEDFHDCGELGGLAQHRRRYLLIARYEKKVMPFVYKPPKKRVKSIGEVLGTLPLPDDPAGGSMHRLPRLQWKTWVRLALIPAGGDWRDLEKVDWQRYRIQHVLRKGALGIADWNEPSGSITGAAGFGRSNATQAISDPRLPERDSRHPGVYRIVRWNETAPTVTGTRFGSGALAISDPRTGFKEGTHGAIYRVSDWEGSSNTVTGAMRPNNGALSVNDPRLSCKPRSGMMGVQAWDEPAKTVIGAGDIHAGAAAVADPRIPDDHETGTWIIIAEDGTWHRPLTTYELAILQGFPTHMPDGRPLELAGKNDARWRERIGNAVPPAAAQAIAETVLRTLMANAMNEWLMAAEEIWVMPIDRKDEGRVIVS
jgi:site-specific DNA-cytosine methylase